MKISTISYEPNATLEENIKSISFLVEEVMIDSTIDLIFFGELALSKYNLASKYIEDNSLSLKDENMNLLKSISINNIVCLSFGYIEEEAGVFYNSQVFIDKEGNIVNNHRKYNLTNKERVVFNNGISPVSFFVYNGIDFASSICFDMSSKDFKIQWRKESNVDVLLHSLTDPQDAKFTLGSSGRFVESYYIASNRHGTENGIYYNGHIGIYSPYGKKISINTNKVGNLNVVIIKKNRNKALLKISNYLFIIFHLIKHIRKTYKYYKWSRENSI